MCAHLLRQASFLSAPLHPCDFVFGSLTVPQVFTLSWLCLPIIPSLPSHRNQFCGTGGNPGPLARHLPSPRPEPGSPLLTPEAGHVVGN